MELPPVQVTLLTHLNKTLPQLLTLLSPAPVDYTSTTNTLTFGPTVTRLPVTIPITDDNVVESIENFFANLDLTTPGANVVINPATTEIRIDDDDRK